jgi:hypothetical protein
MPSSINGIIRMKEEIQGWEVILGPLLLQTVIDEECMQRFQLRMAKRKAASVGKDEQNCNVKSEQDIPNFFTSIRINSEDVVEDFSINMLIGFESDGCQLTLVTKNG